MNTIFRIQDKDGRGPWKPGFSHLWSDNKSAFEYARPPTWMQEFGRVDQLVLPNEWGGTACESIEVLRRWFTTKEYNRLIYFKYKCVKMDVDRILARSEVQCYFARSRPLNVDFEVIPLY
jgi:hypothetical protein